MILRVAGTKREMLYRDAPMGHSQNEIDRVTGRRGNVFWVISEFPLAPTVTLYVAAYAVAGRIAAIRKNEGDVSFIIGKT